MMQTVVPMSHQTTPIAADKSSYNELIRLVKEGDILKIDKFLTANDAIKVEREDKSPLAFAEDSDVYVILLAHDRGFSDEFISRDHLTIPMEHIYNPDMLDYFMEYYPNLVTKEIVQRSVKTYNTFDFYVKTFGIDKAREDNPLSGQWLDMAISRNTVVAKGASCWNATNICAFSDAATAMWNEVLRIVDDASNAIYFDEEQKQIIKPKIMEVIRLLKRLTSKDISHQMMSDIVVMNGRILSMVRVVIERLVIIANHRERLEDKTRHPALVILSKIYEKSSPLENEALSVGDESGTGIILCAKESFDDNGIKLAMAAAGKSYLKFDMFLVENNDRRYSEVVYLEYLTTAYALKIINLLDASKQKYSDIMFCELCSLKVMLYDIIWYIRDCGTYIQKSEEIMKMIFEHIGHIDMIARLVETGLLSAFVLDETKSNVLILPPPSNGMVRTIVKFDRTSRK